MKIVFNIIVVVMLLVSLGFNLMLFLTIKDYPIEMQILRVKLNEMNELLLHSEKRNLEMFTMVEKLHSDIAFANAEIAKSVATFEKLEQNYYSQQHAVENLVKAKNQLFERVSNLESELAKFTDPNRCTVPNGASGTVPNGTQG